MVVLLVFEVVMITENISPNVFKLISGEEKEGRSKHSAKQKSKICEKLKLLVIKSPKMSSKCRKLNITNILQLKRCLD